MENEPFSQTGEPDGIDRSGDPYADVPLLSQAPTRLVVGPNGEEKVFITLPGPVGDIGAISLRRRRAEKKQ